MRIYEFAKKYNFSSKQIVTLLQKKGFVVKSHMEKLDDNAIFFLNETLLKPKKSIEKTKPIEKAGEKKLFKKKDIPEKEEEGFFLESLPLVDIAKKMGKSASEVIVTLLKWGIIATKNQIVSEDIIVRLAQYFDVKIIVKEKKEEEKKTFIASGDIKERPPIVAVVGHVDHGKTTLLDFIRKTHVAMKEKGGITQHLAAYEATTDYGGIVFLDTPGHEAFSKMRKRGIKIADIVVLVVAADDGVAPQAVEAIKYAKLVQVPLIVAINKIDKVDKKNIEIIKQELSQYGVISEDWGGDTVCVPISAKLGTGVDQLLDMLILQAQIMELSADPLSKARAHVLESKIEKGLGTVVTLICLCGSIKVGDYFSCGDTRGKISLLIDSYGNRIKKVGPAIPVQVVGFEMLPEVGDAFEVVSKKEFTQIKTKQKVRKSFVGKRLAQHVDVKFIIKTDTNASREAVLDSINVLSEKLQCSFNIVYSATGNIHESDVNFASTVGAEIIGFNVKTESNTFNLAKRKKVVINNFDVIYDLLDALSIQAKKVKKMQKKRIKSGEAEVIRVFKIKGVGTVAGSLVKKGRFFQGASVVVWRGDEKVGEGTIVSLQREKKSVKEATMGFECGFIVEKFNNWLVGDRVECYSEISADT